LDRASAAAAGDGSRSACVVAKPKSPSSGGGGASPSSGGAQSSAEWTESDRRLLDVLSDLGRTRVIQRRFNVSVPRARVPEKASTLRDRSER
jgi:hypothetical protein